MMGTCWSRDSSCSEIVLLITNVRVSIGRSKVKVSTLAIGTLVSPYEMVLETTCGELKFGPAAVWNVTDVGGTTLPAPSVIPLATATVIRDESGSALSGVIVTRLVLS